MSTTTMTNLSVSTCHIHIAEKERYYSARLYRTLGGFKVEAVFCMCPELTVYTKVCQIGISHVKIICLLFQHCDSVMATKFPEMSDKSKGYFYGAHIVTTSEVSLIAVEAQHWYIPWFSK